ncbi:MAG TPA: LysR substrate-binding domain-containing protein [Candidatus Acidoferrum sp.]|nr:LysR substrate-binding domain-containing protein [Candidatus Acidoferrum sp.]
MVDKERPRSPYPPSSLTLSGLRIFESVVRHSSFSRAAEELEVSQPYVSTQIQELEGRLRVTLFRRVGRRVYLTEAGVLLNRHANELLQRVAGTEHEIAELRKVIVGRLDLATVVIAAEHVLPQALGEFRAQYPEVTLNLQVHNSKEVEEGVADGRYELGITLSHSPSDDLKVEKFGVDELVVVVSKRHRLAGEVAVKPEALANEVFLIREPTSGTRLFVESKFSEIGVPLTYGLELNNNQVIKTLVEANLGIAILSWRTVKAEVLSQRLSSLKVSGLALERPLALVSRKKDTLSPPARAFRSVLLSWKPEET